MKSGVDWSIYIYIAYLYIPHIYIYKEKKKFKTSKKVTGSLEMS